MLSKSASEAICRMRSPSDEEMSPRRIAGAAQGEAAPPSISLSHFQALWTLREIGLAHRIQPNKIGSLRKAPQKDLGSRFDWNRQPTRGKSATYDFCGMMELAVALSLRVYGALPDAITEALRVHRDQLRTIYNEAGMGEASRLWTSAKIEGSGAEVSGVYLELGLAFENGRYVTAGVPAALSAREAIERFAASHPADRSWLPLNVSTLASQIVDAAERAPPARINRKAPSTPASRPPRPT